jgi:hypothetical protein
MIQPDGVMWGPQNKTYANLPGMIVDSGTTLNLFPYGKIHRIQEDKRSKAKC